jgi:hypothetical protein
LYRCQYSRSAGPYQLGSREKGLSSAADSIAFPLVAVNGRLSSFGRFLRLLAFFGFQSDDVAEGDHVPAGEGVGLLLGGIADDERGQADHDQVGMGHLVI